MFMSLGIILALFMKDDWTEEYWYFVSFFPAFIDIIRLVFVKLVYNVESPFCSYSEQEEDFMDNETRDGTEDDEQRSSGPSYLLDNKLNPSKEYVYNKDISTYLGTFYEQKDWEIVFYQISQQYKFKKSKEKGKSMLSLIKDKSYRIQFFLSVVINALNQLTGINAINFYSNFIFTDLKFSNPSLLTLFCGIFSNLRLFVCVGWDCSSLCHEEIWQTVID
jgi:hypothetical protein